MYPIHRSLINICSDDLVASKEFFTTLFSLSIQFESDWFIHLKAENTNFELGIIDKKNNIVPEQVRSSPNGMYLTFVVDSADDVFACAQTHNIPIIQEPHDTHYGQRRLLLLAPDGAVIDVSSVISSD
jgi:predicted enzyme related to lactoylglutathione lyase